MKVGFDRRAAVVLSIVLATLVLSFQNCSPGFEVSNSQLGSLSGGNNPPWGDDAATAPTDVPPDIIADPTAKLSVFVRNLEVRQGGDFVFKIELNKVSDVPVVVQLQTIADTAKPLLDFEASSPSVTILAGQLSAVVSVKAVVAQITTAERRFALRALTASSGDILQADGIAVIKPTQKPLFLKSVGSDFVYSCGLSLEGKVFCWGGVRADATPSEVAGLSGAKQITVGGYDTCVVTATNTVSCFRGSLGPADRVPQEVAGLSGVQSVSGGFDHKCALLADKTVKCWGRNASGQIGQGNNDTLYPTPIAVSGLSDVKQISVGAAFGCALLADGRVACWGDNTYGQLGDGTLVSKFTPTVVPGLVASKLSLGPSASCAFLADGKLKCWGYNVSGQLGLGHTDVVSTPTEVTAVSGIKKIALANSHSCGLMADNKVKCWGDNGRGHLGTSDLTSSLVPREVVGLSAIQDISPACAISATNSVQCWGYNVFGQLGDSTSTRTLLAVDDSALGTVKQISASYAHACALTSTGGVKCWTTGWGQQNSGELGNGSKATSFVPVDVTGITGAKQIATGFELSCAITAADSVKCWGYNGTYMLGDGTTTASAVPVDVVGVSGATQISSNGSTMCSIVAAGKVKCWGASGSGILGNGSTVTQMNVVEVSNLTGATQIAMGVYHGCALLAQGEVKCWGDNQHGGQVGDGSGVDALTPVSIGLTGVKQLAASNATTCAVTSDDKVKCWGQNILDSARASIATPTEVAGFTSVRKVTLAYSTICTVGLDSKVKCIGTNSQGQFGNGTTSLTPESRPVELSRMANASQVFAANSATYAIMQDGHLRRTGVIRQQSTGPIEVTVPAL